MERTLIILKPDALQRCLTGELITRFERRGLKLSAMKLKLVPESLAREHYGEHEGKPFFDGLIEYITSGPVLVMAVDGPDAIKVVRATVGGTRPVEATPGSIRADFGLMVGRNLVHASDAPATAAKELSLWFDESDFVDYSRDIDRWILE
jgi:nucleoside-diphosphate kinase